MNLDNVKQFNNLVTSLLNQLSNVIGISYLTKFEMLVKSNALLPIEQFAINAIPVSDKILNKDESYFIDEVNQLDTSDSYNIIEILNLKNIYFDLDNQSKSNIWDYFQAMLILSQEYVEAKLK
jgi:hypothetical protein